MKATLLKVTGETVEISPVNGNCFTLKEVQNLVNGCVQVIDKRVYLSDIKAIDTEINRAINTIHISCSEK